MKNLTAIGLAYPLKRWLFDGHRFNIHKLADSKNGEFAPKTTFLDSSKR